MHRVNLVQGSPEWLQWRSGRITATDAAIIVGLNPWKSPDELLDEKLGRVIPPPPNDRMKRGTLLEPTARALFIETTGIEVEPACVEHDKMWWHASSLDGLDATGKIIIEVKCPSAETHAMASVFDIPRYYYAQMQHQLISTGADICYYVSYYPDDPVEQLHILEVYPDEVFMQSMLLLEQAFYEDHMCGGVELGWTLRLKTGEG
jgi:putative phage-type endonuclease